MLGGRTSTRLLGQRFLGAVHKGRQSTRKLLQPEDHRIVKHGARGQIAIPVKAALRTASEEQFVAMHPAAQIQNRLTRHIAQPARKIGVADSEPLSGSE